MVRKCFNVNPLNYHFTYTHCIMNSLKRHIVQLAPWFYWRFLTIQDCGSQNMNLTLNEAYWLLVFCEENNWYPYLMKWKYNEKKDLNSCSMLVGMDLVTYYLFFLFWKNSTSILPIEVSTTKKEVLVIIGSPWPSIHQLLTVRSTSTTTKFQAPFYNTQHGFWNNYEIKNLTPNTNLETNCEI